ncbi:uncharacterized protein LOC122279883 isoform X2 [Carya illinoinensis]|uniref:uncharacterized protein LOC122279883 isoform X2 n=1 Tax=Carya illinoinensis TaxID=32201 RepID=UPI001C72464B|nr:uncharacterized protein LOC122279883 isoform X2 [Carya illinoinensis]
MAVHSLPFLFLISGLFPSLFALSDTTTCSASAPPSHQLMCELRDLKLKVSQLELILEDSMQNLNQKSLYIENRENAIEDLSRRIHSLQSTLDGLKGESSRTDERLSALENEVRRLWAVSRKNNFDIHDLESKARDAEERLEKITSQVENMADIVTEQWIQIQRLEQALQIMEFIKNIFGNHHQKVFGVLDPYLFGEGPTVTSYISQAKRQLKRLFLAAKKHHHQLQGFIKQEMERNEFTAALANSEVVFILASALITFPIMGAWVLLSSQFS